MKKNAWGGWGCLPHAGKLINQDLRSLPSRKLNEAELELSTPFYIDFLGGK
jgi:hypothetical protein